MIELFSNELLLHLWQISVLIYIDLFPFSMVLLIYVSLSDNAVLSSLLSLMYANQLVINNKFPFLTVLF